MEMETFKRRNAARIVAYIDAVLTGFTILGLVCWLILNIVATVHADEIADKLNESKTEHDADASQLVGTILVVMWIVTAVCIVVASIELWAVIMLLKATKQGANVSKAIHRALIWRNIMIVFLTIEIVYFLMTFYWGKLAFSLLVRGTMLYFVIMFIKEMEEFVLSGGSRLPTHFVNTKD